MMPYAQLPFPTAASRHGAHTTVDNPEAFHVCGLRGRMRGQTRGAVATAKLAARTPVARVGHLS